MFGWFLGFFVICLMSLRFFFWVARNDFRFRGKSPSAVDVMERVSCSVLSSLVVPLLPFSSSASFLCSPMGCTWCGGFCT